MGASDLYLPLHSNAKALVAGAGVASVRRRLKTASLLFDRIILEGGSIDVTAGPNGAWSGQVPFDKRTIRSHWDTPAARRAKAGKPFSVSMGQETVPGVPSTGPYTVVMQSDASIAWDVSFEPFVAELSAKCDWMGFTVAPLLSDENDRLVRAWKWRDERNEHLVDALPIPFVRNRVIDNANRDLAVATQIGAAVSADNLHQTVMRKRLDDEAGWRSVGYALPMLIPNVGELPWDDIARLRTDKNIEYYRKALAEFEDSVLANPGGDIEARVREAYEASLRNAVGRLETMGKFFFHTAAGLSVGLCTGLATMGFSGPVGPIVGAAAGTVVTAGNELRVMRKTRPSKAWIAMDTRIRKMTAT
ncbi:MAG: hypothetical protein ACYDCS_07160 [Candidatus Dormibacteria bacterium]